MILSRAAIAQLFAALALFPATALAAEELPAPAGESPAAAAEELQVRPSVPDAAAALEVGIVLFQPGSDENGNPATAARDGVFPQVREAEASYLPYALRRTLVDSNHWGAVRVLPQAAAGEVLITGRILHSDGDRLAVELQAADGREAVWFKEVFAATAAADAYAPAQRRRRRPFQSLYNRFANRLLQARKALPPGALAEIRQVTELRYGAALAPAAFNRYLQTRDDGRIALNRLPARDDPMLRRIRRIRAQEYLFIDTVDEQYAELYTGMTPVYDLWRQFQREQIAYRADYEERIAERKRAPKGSFDALKRNYNNYRWAKLQQQELRILAEGFDNEVAPTTLDVEGRVYQLSGSLDDRYREWRRILRQIHALETGGEASAGE